MDRDGIPPRERISEAAAAWVIRLAGPHDRADRAAFETWRSVSIDHEIAFEREMATWEKLDGLSSADPSRAFAAPAPKPVAEAALLGRRHGWHMAAAGLALVAGASALCVTMLAGAPAYATAIGEHRIVRLNDGSSVELNTDSKIVIHYSQGRRSVDLVRGEALFHIVGEARPFLIRAEGAQLDAGRADVSVRLDEAGADVMVTTGVVLASTASRSDVPQPMTSIGPGSEAVIDQGAVAVHPVSDQELARALAWQQGAIALDGRTLDQAVAEFNRYNIRKIAVGDPVAGALHVGGYFKASDVDGFVAALTRAFPVRAAARADGSIVVTSAS